MCIKVHEILPHLSIQQIFLSTCCGLDFVGWGEDESVEFVMFPVIFVISYSPY